MRVEVEHRRKQSFGHILGWSLLVSLFAHLLLLLLSPLFIQMHHPPGGEVQPGETQSRPQGLRVVQVVPSEDAPDVPVFEEEVVEIPVRSTPVVTQPSSGSEGPPAAAGAADAPVPSTPGPSTRDALQPGYRDPRLYVAPMPLPNVRQTDQERYMEHLQARIDAVNDSLGIEARRNSTTGDWTVTDGSGNRWGLSGDGLHLGGITVPRALLPLPGATGDNATQQNARDRQRQREEIQRQEQERERAATERQRIEATRQQQEQRRNSGN